MEITKTVPVTIKTDDIDARSCDIFCQYMDIEWGKCRRYDFHLQMYSPRCPACLAEFGTNEKPERQFIIDDEQIWAAILGLQAAIRECEAEANGSDDPEQSQQDCNWFADHLSGLQRLREMPNERPIGTTESNKQEG